MASRTFLVAQREYVEMVRTKTFWLGILSFPLIFAVAIFIGWLMEQTKETQVYTVADFTVSKLGTAIEESARNGDILDLITENIDQFPAEYRDAAKSITIEQIEAGMSLMPAEQRQMLDKKLAERKEKFRYRSLEDLELTGKSESEIMAALNDRVRDGKLFGFFVLRNDPVADLTYEITEEGEDGKPQQVRKSNVQFICENTNDNDLKNWYGSAATRVIRGQRLAQADISPATAKFVSESVSFVAKAPPAEQGSAATKDIEAADRAYNFAPVFFVYLLWIAVFTAAQFLLTNTVEEKSNRIIEVLLSSCSPSELMAGKIWGIGATGLTIVVSWAIFGVLGMYIGAEFVPFVANLKLLAIASDPLYLASFIAYFFTGYLMFAAMLVALGSVCNSLKEAQNLQQPVILLLMVPLLAMVPIVQEPNGLMAKVFTYIPIYTPFAMMNRASGPPSTIEYVITTALILFSVWFAFKAAGKIFRIGILMTGNPPKIRDIIGWLREK